DRLRRQVPTVTRERPRSPDIQASLKDSRPHARQQVHEHQRFSKKFTSRILRQSRRDREFRKLEIVEVKASHRGKQIPAPLPIVETRKRPVSARGTTRRPAVSPGITPRHRRNIHL